VALGAARVFAGRLGRFSANALQQHLEAPASDRQCDRGVGGGLAFVYGGVAVYTYHPALWAAALAFFFHLGREIIKDMEDEPGDRAAGAATIPVRYGMTQARSMAIISFIFLLFCLPLPYYWGHFQKLYLWMALGSVAPVVIFVAILTGRWTKPEQLHRLALALKLDMLAGLLALYLGRPL
jgi:geranylgeranylglycerol-phosphate geranylgeranyltransferase